MDIRTAINLIEALTRSVGLPESEIVKKSTKTHLREGVFYRGPIDSAWGTDQVEIVVLENPSAQQFAGLLNRSEHRELRALISKSIYVWDASLATHTDLENGLDLDGERLDLTADTITVVNIDPNIDDAALAALHHMIIESPSLTRIYRDKLHTIAIRIQDDYGDDLTPRLPSIGDSPTEWTSSKG